MASLRQIRGRLRSISSTKQIMRAMQLVSASKLKRSQARLMQTRAVLGFLDGLLARVLAAAPGLAHPTTRLELPKAARLPPSGGRPIGGGRQALRATARWWDHPLATPREGSEVLVIFTSDAGLCGAYNTNLIQLAEAHLRRDTARQTDVMFIGKKGHRYFTKRGYQAVGSYLDLAGRTNLKKAEAIGRSLMERFLSGKAGSVRLLYSYFKSSAASRPTILQWLPIQLPVTDHHGPAAEYIFEPSARRIFDDLLPRWALATFTLVMLEAFTSEHSARMIAMKNATDNAEEILKALTLQRNKTRQAAITREISEIVGTTDALR